MKIRCEWCDTTVTHVPRRLIGCNCDPDAPQWCYIDHTGDARGFSQAKWHVVESTSGEPQQT